MDPNCEFEKLHPPQWTFWQHYKPLFDHAAFADNAITENDFIIDGKYLKVWIDLSASKNQIRAALKKELDEWLRKFSEFYGGKRKRKPADKAILVDSAIGKHLAIHINLEAPRTTKTKAATGYIEPEVKVILAEWLAKLDGTKEKIGRLHADKWELCFQVYDLAETGEPFPKISIKLKIPVDTVRKQYKRAWQAIYPGEPYSTKRQRKKEILVETLETDCTTCPAEKLHECTQLYLKESKLLCPEKNKYIGQDERSGDYLPPRADPLEQD